MVESGKITLSSQFVQLPDTPTNFHRPSTSRSTKLAKSLNPSPNSPKESKSSTVTPITYQGQLLILSTKLHPDSSTPSVFQDFPLQLPPRPMSKYLVRIWNKSSKKWIPSIYQILLRSGHPFLSLKFLNFSNFSKLTPPAPPKRMDPFQLCQSRI